MNRLTIAVVLSVMLCIQAQSTMPAWIDRLKACLKAFPDVMHAGEAIYSDLQTGGAVTPAHLTALSDVVGKFGSDCLHMQFPALSDACAGAVGSIEEKYAQVKKDKGNPIAELVDKAKLAFSVAAAGKTCLSGALVGGECSQIQQVMERTLDEVKKETDEGVAMKKINGAMFFVARDC
jgi:hypothetical protein